VEKLVLNGRLRVTLRPLNTQLPLFGSGKALHVLT
jgi:hypothetical protein